MAERLRVALADDESMARKRLARLLEALPDVQVVGVYESGQELLQSLAESPCDVVLLDIQMPELSGLDAAALLSGDDAPYVIFVTAHSEHALEAFEQGALDYVLKPVDAARLKRALSRARRARGGGTASARSLERLGIRTTRGIVLVDPELVSHAVYDGQLVTLHVGATTVVSDFTLSELEARMPGDLLLRVHRRYLLNLSMVERLEPLDDGGYTAIVRGGASVPVARQAARMLRKRLGV